MKALWWSRGDPMIQEYTHIFTIANAPPTPAKIARQVAYADLGAKAF